MPARPRRERRIAPRCMPRRREWHEWLRRIWPPRGWREWRRRGMPVRSPILAAAARMAAVLPSISVAVGRRMAAVDQRAVAAGDRMGVAVAAKASISAGSPGPERTPATQAFIEHNITKLNEQVMQLALPQGRIDLRVRTLLEGESIEIDLPRGAVWILQPGTYDIDAGAPDQPERIAVFEGSARFVGGTLDVAIKAGDAAVISGTQTLTATEKASPDEFAKWCRSRDYDE